MTIQAIDDAYRAGRESRDAEVQLSRERGLEVARLIGEVARLQEQLATTKEQLKGAHTVSDVQQTEYMRSRRDNLHLRTAAERVVLANDGSFIDLLADALDATHTEDYIRTPSLEAERDAAQAQVKALVEAGDAILAEPLPWKNNQVVETWDKVKIAVYGPK